MRVETRLCPTCGGHTPSRYPLCGHCGTRLSPDSSAAEIRRFATVVNSDLKGSTALGERLDPESLREVLTLYFDEMRLVFESHGGTIEKIIGDAIVAVFGLPVQHEDDALRAVEAAAESQQVLASLNDRLDATWGVRLVVRTGIATGEVVFGEASLGQHVLTGDTMKISSAMEQNAPPLEVLLAESTYDIVRKSVEIEALGPVTPKGMGVSIPTFRLVSVAPRPQAGHAGADSAAAGMRLCPACGEENPEDFRNCGMCRTQLALVAPARESRKTVTLVFADPKPTTADGLPPGAEALRDVMTRYFDAMREALERHGGTVEKFIGDAVMAVFGLPVRHEDDAVRAVRAAADMQAALPALNDDFRARWGLELRNHIGVNTGEVIAGDASLGQRLVTGDAVNTAARLEQAAGAQEIILGDLTYRLARDQVVVDPIAPLTLKGKAEPVPAYRLLSVQQRPAERRAPATPFVGRQAEMARLRDALLDAEGHRACRLLTVLGDAGVGKSRLIREFSTAISEQAHVVRGRCLPYGDGITFWPIGEIVRSAAAISDDDDAADAIAKMASLVAEEIDPADDPADIAGRVAAAIGLSDAQFQLPELFWGIRKLLEALGRRQPLVAIVDDIHVAAPAFLELVDHLIEASVRSSILLLTTARHELRETHADWSEAHAAEQITLAPLSASEAGSIIEDRLTGLDDSVRARIVAAAEGNPLYVEQITSMLVETGAIRREDERWIATTTSDHIAIPPTVQALVAARLDALGSDERSVIEPASVIGYSFPGEALMELVDEETRTIVPAQLESLESKQLVRVSSGDADVYRFGHNVIKDTTYGSLLKRTRAALHERFVDWAEPINRERGRETEFEEILGYHLEQAYRYRTELGPADDRALAVGRRAADKLGAAGRRALARTDMAAASDLLSRAAVLLPEAEPIRVELLTDLAEAQQEHGDIAAAVATVEAAIAGARSLADDRLLARARVGQLILGVYAPDQVNLEGDPHQVAEELTRLLEQHRDDPGLARAWRARAMLRSKAGQYDDVVAAADRLIEHARLAGDKRLIARGASGYANQAVYSAVPVSELIDRIESYLRSIEGDRKAEASISLGLAQLQAMQGQFERGRELYRRGQRLLRDLGPSISAMYTSLASARVEVLAGDLAAAENELTRDDGDLAAIGERYYRCSIVAVLARVRLLAGDVEGAAAACRVVEEIADPDDTDAQTLLRSVRGGLAARQGDRDAAMRELDEALRLSDETADVILQADVLVDRSLALRALGDRESAGPPLREALRLYERKGDAVSAARTRAMLDPVAADDQLI